MIVVEELISPPLNENQIGFLERSAAKLFTTECSIESFESFNESLLILLVRASDAVAIGKGWDGLSTPRLEFSP